MWVLAKLKGLFSGKGLTILLLAALGAVCFFWFRSCNKNKALNVDLTNSLWNQLNPSKIETIVLKKGNRKLLLENYEFKNRFEKLQKVSGIKRVKELVYIKGESRIDTVLIIDRDTIIINGHEEVERSIFYNDSCREIKIHFINKDSIRLQDNTLIEYCTIEGLKHRKNWFWNFQWGKKGWLQDNRDTFFCPINTKLINHTIIKLE